MPILPSTKQGDLRQYIAIYEAGVRYAYGYASATLSLAVPRHSPTFHCPEILEKKQDLQKVGTLPVLWEEADMEGKGKYCKGVARIWFRGGTHFGGPTPYFSPQTPNHNGPPLMYFWLPPDFGGGGAGTPAPPWLRPWNIGRGKDISGRGVSLLLPES